MDAIAVLSPIRLASGLRFELRPRFGFAPAVCPEHSLDARPEATAVAAQNGTTEAQQVEAENAARTAAVLLMVTLLWT